LKSSIVRPPTRFSEDSARQERLATDRIRLLKQEHRVAWQPEVGERLEEVSQAKQLGPVASWIEATKLMEIHGALEREVREDCFQICVFCADGAASPNFCGDKNWGSKMFDFRRATAFLFGTLLLKAQNN